MQAVTAAVCLVTLFAFATATFNPYPRYERYICDTDPGEPLYLTDYIERNELTEARQLSLVKYDAIPANIVSHSGYFTVNRVHGSNLFFWYFPAALQPKTAPVVLWLQGGPGASSLFGLFTENGPFSVDINQTVTARQYSWHQQHHLIYIDNPVGTGYSTVADDAGYATNEKDVGRDLYAAMQQFFTVFSELRSHEFYITGESYAGKYIPALAHTIHHENAKLWWAPQRPKINLIGMAIGNGLSDPLHQMNYGDYLYQLGLIDRNGHAEFEALEKKGMDCIKKEQFECAFEVFDELLNADQTPYGSLFTNLTGFQTYYNYITPETSTASDEALGRFLQSPETRRALHVGNNSWNDVTGENRVEQHLKCDVMNSVAPWVSELLSHYKVLIYNGQLDIIVAYPLTVNYLSHLKFNGDHDYTTAVRHVWKVDGQVAGYVKHAGNLTEVLVRNAGHMVPADQPKWALDMLLRLTMKKGFFN